MRDQETDRGGMAYQSLVDLPLNRSRSSQLSCLGSGNSISSWGFQFEGYKMWCGFISLEQFRFKGRVLEGTQT
ncbi:hypothetical protein AB3S75_033372 [Citrus x aurantiifolia]